MSDPLEEIEQLKEKVLQLERDLEDLRRPVIERSIEELDQEQRDTLADLARWLEKPTGPVYRRSHIQTVRLLYELYVQRAESVSALRVELSKQTHLAQAEHTRADEAVLDLRNECGRERALVRLVILQYLEHLAETAGETLCSIDGAAIHLLAQWIRKGLDVEYDHERQKKLDGVSLMLGESWEEKCVLVGHAPLCEKMYYENSNVCSCGREAWEKMRAKREKEDKT